MPKILPLLVTLLLTGSALPQVSMKQGPKVNGIGLGATRQEVIKKLGRPVRESRRNADECVGGTEMTLSYPGLKILLWDDAEDRRKFTVGQFEVTSAKWDVSGSRIGQTNAAVRKLFGPRSSEERESGSLVWYYNMDENISPGNTNFYFRGGKVVKIVSLWLMC